MRRPMIIIGTCVGTLALAGCTSSPTLSRSPDAAASNPAATTSPNPDRTPSPGSTVGTAPPTGATTGVPGGAPSPTGPPTFVIEPTTTIASDQTPANTIVGTVTATSSGPCYLIETDDGRPYALYGSAGAVTRGQRVRVQTAPMSMTVDCGPGVLVRLVKLET